MPFRVAHLCVHPELACYGRPVPRQAGLYLRISKDRTGEGLAVDRQRDAGAALIELRGWSLAQEYTDNDITGSGRKRRPGFEQMLRDIESGKINVVVSLSLDRLSRNRREQLHLVEACQEHSVLIALVRGSDLDLSTAMGRAVADLMMVPARLEIESKSERHIDQIEQAAKRGLILGGRRAFGYAEGGMALDVVEAPILRSMYARFLGGESMGALARWLNDSGVTTPRGSQWRHHTVREVLGNPRNAAIRGMRPVVNKKTGTRARWHVVIGPAAWPGVVPEETWRAALELIKDPNRPGNHVGSSAQKYLLTGLALCGVCLRPVITGGSAGDGFSVERDGGKRYRRLRCPSRRHVSRRADRVEAFVEEQVIGYFTGTDRPALSGTEEDFADLDAIRLEAAGLRERIRGLAVDYADGTLDREGVRVAGARMRERLAALDAEVAAAGMVDVTARLRAAVDPEEVWDDMLIPEQRAVIRRIMTIRIMPHPPGRLGGMRFHEETVLIDWLR